MRVSLPMYIFFSPVFLTFKNSYRLSFLRFPLTSIRSLGIYRALLIVEDQHWSGFKCANSETTLMLFHFTRGKKGEILSINCIASNILHFVHTRIQNQLNMYKIIKNKLSRDVCSSISTYKRLIVKSKSRIECSATFVETL